MKKMLCDKFKAKRAELTFSKNSLCRFFHFSSLYLVLRKKNEAKGGVHITKNQWPISDESHSQVKQKSNILPASINQQSKGKISKKD
jgi:hypothetical protein